VLTSASKVVRHSALVVEGQSGRSPTPFSVADLGIGVGVAMEVTTYLPGVGVGMTKEGAET